MTIISDLNNIENEFSQAEIALKYRRIFDDVYTRLKSIDEEIASVAGSQKFDTIPVLVKQALNRYWQQVQIFTTAIEADEEIMEMLNWNKPTSN